MSVVIQFHNDVEGTATLRDITEGQYNLVTTYAILQEKKVNGGTSRLEHILLSKTTDKNELNEARDILMSTHAFEFSEASIASLVQEIVTCAKEIGGNKFCEEVLIMYNGKKLSDW